MRQVKSKRGSQGPNNRINILLIKSNRKLYAMFDNDLRFTLVSQKLNHDSLRLQQLLLQSLFVPKEA